MRSIWRFKKSGDELDCYYINVNEIFDDAQRNLLKNIQRTLPMYLGNIMPAGHGGFWTGNQGCRRGRLKSRFGYGIVNAEI